MKERPILMSGPMVRAILEGRKTQTRRIVKGASGPFWEHTGYRIKMRDGFTFWETHSGIPNEWGPAIACPYGKPGDRLWVRETHAIWHRYATTIDDPEFPIETGAHYRATHDESQAIAGRWRPSIHMPRWASRINLEVESVRVERLQEISEADAIAEGIDRRFPPEEQHAHAASVRYMNLWESINGPGSWDANPWVWVVEFKRVING